MLATGSGVESCGSPREAVLQEFSTAPQGLGRLNRAVVLLDSLKNLSPGHPHVVHQFLGVVLQLWDLERSAEEGSHEYLVMNCFRLGIHESLDSLPDV